MSAQKTILVFTVILYSANQVSSLKCYTCGSTTDEDCYKDPAKKKYEKNCAGSRSAQSAFELPNIVNSTFLSSLQSTSALGGDQVFYASSYECCKARGTQYGTDSVLRSCILKSSSDEYIKDELRKKVGFIVDSLYRCGSDLCNSSSSLSIGFFSIITVLFFVLFNKL